MQLHVYLLLRMFLAKKRETFFVKIVSYIVQKFLHIDCFERLEKTNHNLLKEIHRHSCFHCQLLRKM